MIRRNIVPIGLIASLWLIGYALLSYIPWYRFISDFKLIMGLEVLTYLLFLVLLVVFLIFNKSIKIEKRKVRFKPILYFIPCILLGLSSLISALFIPSIFSYSFHYTLLFKYSLSLVRVIIEAILFRGMLFIIYRHYAPIVKILICSLYYAFIYLNSFIQTPNIIGLLPVLFMFVVGVVTSLIYEYTKSLNLSIGFHLIYVILSEWILSNLYIAYSEETYILYLIIQASLVAVILMYCLTINYFVLEVKYQRY